MSWSWPGPPFVIGKKALVSSSFLPIKWPISVAALLSVAHKIRQKALPPVIRLAGTATRNPWGCSRSPSSFSPCCDALKGSWLTWSCRTQGTGHQAVATNVGNLPGGGQREVQSSKVRPGERESGVRRQHTEISMQCSSNGIDLCPWQVCSRTLPTASKQLKDSRPSSLPC